MMTSLVLARGLPFLETMKTGSFTAGVRRPGVLKILKDSPKRMAE